MIMNAVIARSKIKKSIEEDLETRSHSSKEDIDSQITSIPSNRTLNIFDQQFTPKDTEILVNDAKQNRKNHVFIRMSARINGIEFSPENMKASQIFQTYQQNNYKSQGFKKIQEKNLNNSKVFQKILEKQTEIKKLQEQNKKLAIDNQELRNFGPQRRNFKSSDRIILADNIITQGVRVIKRQNSSNSISQKLKIEEQLTKSQQIKTHLQKRVLDLEIQVVNKDQAIKDIMKQSQHQINLLYDNLSKRLKARQLQSYMNGKQLKQQKQKIALIQQKLLETSQQNAMLTTLVNNNNKDKQQLINSIRLQQDQIRKNKIVTLRLEHCESQLKYFNEQLSRYKEEQTLLRRQNMTLKTELNETKKQLSQFLSKSIKSSMKCKLFFCSSFQGKQDQSIKNNSQITQNEIAYKQLQIVSKKYIQTHQLLQQSNDKIMKLSMGLLNGIISKKSY